jgi:hypothetical protein
LKKIIFHSFFIQKKKRMEQPAFFKKTSLSSHEPLSKKLGQLGLLGGLPNDVLALLFSNLCKAEDVWVAARTCRRLLFFIRSKSSLWRQYKAHAVEQIYLCRKFLAAPLQLIIDCDYDDDEEWEEEEEGEEEEVEKKEEERDEKEKRKRLPQPGLVPIENRQQIRLLRTLDSMWEFWFLIESSPSGGYPSGFSRGLDSPLRIQYDLPVSHLPISQVSAENLRLLLSYCREACDLDEPLPRVMTGSAKSVLQTENEKIKQHWLQEQHLAMERAARLETTLSPKEITAKFYPPTQQQQQRPYLSFAESGASVILTDKQRAFFRQLPPGKLVELMADADYLDCEHYLLSASKFVAESIQQEIVQLGQFDDASRFQACDSRLADLFGLNCRLDDASFSPQMQAVHELGRQWLQYEGGPASRS